MTRGSNSDGPDQRRREQMLQSSLHRIEEPRSVGYEPSERLDCMQKTTSFVARVSPGQLEHRPTGPPKAARVSRAQRKMAAAITGILPSLRFLFCRFEFRRPPGTVRTHLRARNLPENMKRSGSWWGKLINYRKSWLAHGLRERVLGSLGVIQ